MKPGSKNIKWGARALILGWQILFSALTPLKGKEALAPSEPRFLSPTALAVTRSGDTAYVGCATVNQVIGVDLRTGSLIAQLDVPAQPLGLVLSRDNSRLYVACAAAMSTVCVVELPAGRIVKQIATGHTAMSPLLSPDEKTLYVCNRFNDSVAFIDLGTGRESHRVRALREPVAAALTPDGSLLVVANHLCTNVADELRVDAGVSIIRTDTGTVARHVHLPEGSGLSRGVAISPDGHYAAITHVVARYWESTLQADYGGINCNGVSLVDLRKLDYLGTVLLDTWARGAANPWAITWTADGKTIAVSHAGTHELSLIEAPDPAHTPVFFSLFLSRSSRQVPDPALPPPRPVRVRQRLSLGGKGPRALAVCGSGLLVANYFSDDLCLVDLEGGEPPGRAIPLGPAIEPTLVRRGEMLFNDGTLCRGNWQSCASCHDSDGRVDGLNWDLLNDGAKNPKNTKSLLWAHQTPPAMALGVRTNAETAVRAGLQHILFSDPGKDVPEAIDAYLKSLRPMTSPWLVEGRLSAAAERGKALFNSAEVGCARCHPEPWFTDRGQYDVATVGRRDRPTDRFDTPSLVELWRTAPYLHDGRAARLEQVLGKFNARDKHGNTSHLTCWQIADLVEYLLSL